MTVTIREGNEKIVGKSSQTNQCYSYVSLFPTVAERAQRAAK